VTVGGSATDSISAADFSGAIARIEASLPGGQLQHGTGVLVTEKLVLTALHVVGNRRSDPPAFYDEHGATLVLKFPHHETRGRVIREYRGVRPWSSELDFALIECDRPVPGVSPVPLRHEVRAREIWSTFGFPSPAERDGMVFNGEVANPQAKYAGAEAIQLYSQQAAAGNGAPVRGLSGGPVFVGGAVVGVLRSSLMDAAGANVAGTVYACPASVIVKACGGMIEWSKKAGAPRWTYVVAAMVALATLAWISSHFIPRPPVSRSDTQETQPAVQVSGDHNIGVGVMSGGTINQGVDPALGKRPEAAKSPP
jgi:hypothetical protein